jgi:gamma-glutamylcyclotransferase (GGCT)/AIG2-like uncharacterized protein YtfP
MEPRSDKLFVYGTLLEKFPLHGYLRKGRSRLIGRGQIRAVLFDLGRYPGAFPSRSPADVVEGELYELGDVGDQLKLIDKLEEFYPERPIESLFVRKLTTVRLKTGRKLRAWAYFLPKVPKNGKRIVHGDYAAA